MSGVVSTWQCACTAMVVLTKMVSPVASIDHVVMETYQGMNTLNTFVSQLFASWQLLQY